MKELHHKKDIYEIIAENIKKYRRLKKLTQKELALKSGYSYSFIRKIESKKCKKNFSIMTIYNISKALNINIKCLFNKDDI